MVNFLGKSKNRENRHFQKWPKIAFYAVWGHPRGQYVSKNSNFLGAQTFTRGNVSKSFVCQNMHFGPKSRILDLEFLAKSRKIGDLRVCSTGVYLAPPVAKSIFDPGFGKSD